MVRIKRVYYNNAVYHVVFRGNNRQAVLKHSADKIALLKTLDKYKKRLDCKLYGFVIMDNHAHLVIEANQKNNISKIMQVVLLSYSLKFRQKYDYCGHVWQGRFRSKAIEGGSYIFDCFEYIHNNPVRANIVARAQDYLWSSYFFYNGLTNRTITSVIDLDKYGDTSCITY